MPYTQLYQSISTKNKVEAKRIHSMLRWYSWCNAGDVVTYLYKLRCLAICYHQSSIIIKITHKRTFVERATFVFVGRGVAFSKKKKKFNNDKKKGTLTEHDAKAIQAQTISKAMYSTQQSQGKNWNNELAMLRWCRWCDADDAINLLFSSRKFSNQSTVNMFSKNNCTLIKRRNCFWT